MGGQASSINTDGNYSSSNAGAGTASTTSSINSGNTATVKNDGSINVGSSTATPLQTQAAASSLTNATQQVQSIQDSISIGDSKGATNIVSAGKNGQVTASDGASSKVSETTSETAAKMTATANKEAFGSTSKNSLLDSISNDKAASTTLRAAISSKDDDKEEKVPVKGSDGKQKIGADGKPEFTTSKTGGNLAGQIISKLTGASASLDTDGNVSIKASDGTSFSLSKDSAFGKEFTSQFSKSINNQMSNSKDNTMAVADITSAVHGENSSNANSTLKQTQEAYSKLESASTAYSDVQTKGSSTSNALLTSAFQNHFENSPSWKNATPQQKSDFAVRKLDEWNQSQDGIKNSNDFIRDNTSSPKIVNTADTKQNIDERGKNLKEQTSDVKKQNYNPNVGNSTENAIKELKEGIDNTHPTNEKLNADVKENVKDGDVIAKNVNEKINTADKTINDEKQHNANKFEGKVMPQAVEALDGVVGKSIESIKSMVGAKETNINTDAKMDAKLNKDSNEQTYKNAQNSNNDGLVKRGYAHDEINTSKLQNASDEDLARIYQHNQSNGRLTNDSKEDLVKELKSRNYDTNSNKYSGEYKAEELQPDSIIKNGRGKNPGVSTDKQDLNGYDKDYKSTWF